MATAPAGKLSPTRLRPQNVSIWHEDLYFNGESFRFLQPTAPPTATAWRTPAFGRVSAGDIFMTTTYPVIDVNNGGSINGVISGLNHLLDLTIPKEKQEGGTMVIPGHGRISDEADVVEYRDMVTIIRDRIRDAIKKGKTLQQVQSSGLTKDYDPRYGSNTGPWTTAMFVEAAYQSLSRKQ
jgi:hypothetical protein